MGDDGLCWPKSGVGMSGIAAGFGVEGSETCDVPGEDGGLSEDTVSAAEVSEVLGTGGVLSVDDGSGCSTWGWSMAGSLSPVGVVSSWLAS